MVGIPSVVMKRRIAATVLPTLLLSEGRFQAWAFQNQCGHHCFQRCLSISHRPFLTFISLNDARDQQQSSECNYFLLKSEPEEFSIQDLRRCQEEEWDGIRNFQARNKLRLMKVGDLAFFYHSSCKVPAIVGTMKIVREVAPDSTALDPKHSGYDPKSTPENCRWDSVRVRMETIFENPVTLKRLKELATNDDAIAEMSVLHQSRLSVHEVTPEQWERVMELSEQKADETLSENGEKESSSSQSSPRKRKRKPASKT